MPFDSTNFGNPDIRILEEARNLLQRGWCRNYSKRRTVHGPQYCIMGSLRQAAKTNNVTHYLKESGRVASEYIYPEVPNLSAAERMRYGMNKIDVIEYYNDTGTRTKEEVLKTMDRAIARAREKINAV